VAKNSLRALRPVRGEFLQLKSAYAGMKPQRNGSFAHWRHVKRISWEIDMDRLELKQQLAFAVLGTLASACTLALAVLGPLAA
jgi:hypothetical protein